MNVSAARRWILTVAAVSAIVSVQPANAAWQALGRSKGVVSVSHSGTHRLTVACGDTPSVVLEPTRSKILGAVVKNMKLDGELLSDGRGIQLGFAFEPILGASPRFLLERAPRGFVDGLTKGLVLEAEVLEQRIAFSLRGFTAAYRSACGRGQSKAEVGRPDPRTLVSSATPSGWKLQLIHDCARGEFVFTPTAPKAKWDMGRQFVDGERLPRIPLDDIVIEGDLDGAIRYPFTEGWRDRLSSGKKLTIAITDYGTIGGPKEVEVFFELSRFCPSTESRK